MTTPPPSVAVMGLSKKQYIELADQFRESAQQAHQGMRALLAESSLAALKAAYEPHATDPRP